MPSACFNQKWPNVENCVLWRTWPELGIRTVESNSVPPYHVEPYCPFGLGEGYCNSPIEGPSDNCTLFSGITCPCIEGTEGCPTSTLVGDVLTPHYQYVEFPLHPDPTTSDLPKNMYNHTGHNGGPDEFKPVNSILWTLYNVLFIYEQFIVFIIYLEPRYTFKWHTNQWTL